MKLPAGATSVAPVCCSMRYHKCMRSFPFRGMTLIDVLVGTGLVLTIFVSLLGLVRVSVEIIGVSKLKAAATALASTNMEYVRSLEYGAVGTVGGIPSGAIAQIATTTLNGIEYTVRTFIVYVDDAADGVGTEDANAVPTDYKRVKVTVTYEGKNGEHDVSLVSNQAPLGIESTVPGGTLRIGVVSAAGLPISGASVRVQNDSVSPSVDVTTFSDITGTVLFSGAPTSTDYHIEVTKSGYSSTQTYARDATNQNPAPGYLTVALNQTTTADFAIDQLASFTLQTLSPIQAYTVVNPLDTSDGFSSFTNAEVTGSALILSGTPGTYPENGSATGGPVAPAYLAAWTSASSTTSLHAGTNARIHIADGDGVLLPDAALPGNAAGFSGTVTLSGISTSTYPSLSPVFSLSSTDPNSTPSVVDYELGYDAGPVPLPDVSFTLTGAKTIGTDGGELPLYKTVVATTTSASGSRTLLLEWDLYELSIPGYAVVASSTPPPYEFLPATTLSAWLELVP